METSDINEKIKVLYLDDEEFNLHAFKATFRFKYQVFVTTKALDALQLIEEEGIFIVISDQRMPEITGVEFLKMVVGKFPNTKRIMLTGYSDHSDTVNAINDGKICQYVTKPWNEEGLDAIIQASCKQYFEEEAIRAKADQLEDVSKERDQYKIESDQIEFMLRQKLLE